MPDLGLKPSVLVGTAVATALLHTLIPDHWLPFVLIGRARNWSVTTTAAVSGVSALIHALLSALLGVAAIAIGVGSARALGESLGQASAVLLLVFGAAYAAWAWRKGGHFHPGGRLLHAESSEASCPGHESGSHPGHLHYHADGDLIHGPDRRCHATGARSGVRRDDGRRADLDVAAAERALANDLGFGRFASEKRRGCGDEDGQ